MNEESSHRLENEREDPRAAEVSVRTVVSFAEIARGAAEIEIEHEGHVYRLRATRNGRLVLNK